MYFSKTPHNRVVIVIYNVPYSSFIPNVTLSLGSLMTTFIHLSRTMELLLVDKTMLPIENSFNGSIHWNFNLHLRHCLHIVWEVQLLVHHCLLVIPSMKKKELQLSHKSSIDTSREFQTVGHMFLFKT